MQGPKENILTSTDKILAFKNKIQVWKKHLSSGNTEMFPLLLQVWSQILRSHPINYQSFGITDGKP
jgi:hypothetical protein